MVQKQPLTFGMNVNKGIYSDDEVFAQMLDYAKTHDTQKSDIF